MKNISSALLTHLAQEVTTLATCWKVTRADGTVQGFTDHIKNIVVDGVTYEAATGYTRTAIVGNSDLSVPNMDVDGILDSDGISEVDLRAGRYDYAEVLVFMVNYEAPSDGTIILRRGRLGETTIRDGMFVTEIRGLAQAYSKTFVEVYTQDCAASLGDSRCQVNMTPLTDTGTVTAVTTARRAFSATFSTARADNFYVGGLLTWTSGDNFEASVAMEVKSFASGAITLFLPTGYAIAVGDTFTVTAGCDRSFATCKATFNNVANFRGFPHIPGNDKILKTPDAH